MSAVWIEVRVLVDPGDGVADQSHAQARKVARRLIMEVIDHEPRIRGFAELGPVAEPVDWQAAP